jgi:hypothetical protein
MRRARRTLTLVKIGFLCGILAIAFSMPAQDSRPGTGASAVGSFDAPPKKKVVDFGPSSYYPNPQTAPHVKLSCFYFPAFMVKQYDEGEKGAEWLSIVPIATKQVPSCTRAHVSGEKVIGAQEWSGYFKGVKTNLVFFDAADGTNDGLPFAVYDSRTGKKIFEDSAYESSMWNEKVKESPFNHLQVSIGQDGQLLLRYLRVVEAGCDLHTEKAACWDQIRKKLELKSDQMPVCSGYKRISDRWASAIAYPVEVSLPPQSTIKTTAGPVKCWPVD